MVSFCCLFWSVCVNGRDAQFRQLLDDETAFHNVRVGHDEPVAPDDSIPVIEDVQVYGSAVIDRPAAHNGTLFGASETPFDLLQGVEQFKRAEPRKHNQDLVEERRCVKSPSLRLLYGRGTHNLSGLSGDKTTSLRQESMPVAQIAAKPDDGTLRNG